VKGWLRAEQQRNLERREQNESRQTAALLSKSINQKWKPSRLLRLMQSHLLQYGSGPRSLLVVKIFFEVWVRLAHLGFSAVKRLPASAGLREMLAPTTDNLISTEGITQWKRQQGHPKMATRSSLPIPQNSSLILHYIYQIVFSLIHF
jgi:hypothetical protein